MNLLRASSRASASQCRRTGPCRLHLGDQRRRAFFVPWRKMKRHDRLGSDAAGDLAGLACRQVILARPMLRVLVQENAFDEKQVNVGEQSRKRLQVRLGVAEVRNVANALPGNDVQDHVTQFTDLSGYGVLAMSVPPLHQNWRLAPRTGQNRLFQLAQPRPRRQPERHDAVLPHIDDASSSPEAIRNVTMNRRSAPGSHRAWSSHIHLEERLYSAA